MKKTLLIVISFLALMFVCGCNNTTQVQVNGIGEMTNEEFLDQYTYLNTTNMNASNGKCGVTGIGDPYLFYHEEDDCYYMTSTCNGANGFNLFKSKDLTTWEKVTQIFKTSDVEWGDFGPGHGLWGPEIHKVGNKYYLYYSSWIKTGTSPRIGVAVADTLTGPYVDKGEPFFDFGYSAIDNHLFKDTDGKYYFYYCKDASDNIIDGVHTSEIWCVKVNDDMMSTETEDKATRIIGPDQEWEVKSGGGTWEWVEGCWMQKHGDKYYLFYSANKYSEAAYAIGYAVSDNPMSGFTKPLEEPLIKTSADIFSGPGNNSFFTSKDGKELLTAYHMHTDPYNPSGDRCLNIDRIGFREDGSVYFSGQTATNQPIPSGTKEHHTLLNDKATVKVPTVLEGFNSNGLLDGEVVIFGRNSKYQYVSSTAAKDTTIEIDFNETQIVNSLFIYNAFNHLYQADKVNLEFSDGTKIEGVKLSNLMGEAAIVNLSGVACDWIKITVNQEGFGQTNFGLSEIMIFGE